MEKYDIKTIDCKALDVDNTTRRVKVALNKTGVKDNDKDIVEAHAFDKTIQERGPNGKSLVWHLTDHRASLKDAVGKFKELYMENGYLVGVTEIPNTTWGNDVLEFYKTESINQHSIGYAVTKREVYNDDDWATRYQVLKEVTLFEGSAVLWGANEDTPTLSVGKSMTKEEKKTEFEKAMNDLGSLHKLFRDGHLSDQSFELIEIKMRQLSEKIKMLFEETTEAAENALQPVEKGHFDVLDSFKNKLKIA